MQRLLYYPNFEIRDENFLKFALLYIDEIQPIIPYCAQNSLNMTMRDIMEHTNLIKPYSPSYDDGVFASNAAIQYLENYLKYGEGIHCEKNTLAKRNYILYQDKFSCGFECYCLDNQLAERCNEGIRLNENVGYIYMSILANVISMDKNIDMITDCSRYADVGLNGKRGKRAFYTRLKETERELLFQLPVDLRYIPIEEFVRLRSSEKFEMARKSFVREWNKLLDMRDAKEENIDLKDYLCCREEICALLLQFGTIIETYNVLVQTYGNTKVGDSTVLDFFNGMGGMITLGKVVHDNRQVKNYVDSIKGKTLARKYLANLKQFGYRGVSIYSNNRNLQ